MTHFLNAVNFVFVAMLFVSFTYPTKTVKTVSVKGLTEIRLEPIQQLKQKPQKALTPFSTEQLGIQLNQTPLHLFQADSTAVSTVEKESVITLRNGVLFGIGAALVTVLVIFLGTAEKSPF